MAREDRALTCMGRGAEPATVADWSGRGEKEGAGKALARFDPETGTELEDVRICTVQRYVHTSGTLPTCTSKIARPQFFFFFHCFPPKRLFAHPR